MSSPFDYIFNDNSEKTGFIAQDLGVLFPGMIVKESTLPTPVLSITAPPENNISMYAGANEILKITEEGFYVRGKKVEADEKEAAAVYKAFKEFLIHHALTRN